MAYIQVEASVRTHRKFLKAGPAASWLWLCGVGYCQDGLTDGFIPFEALNYLGVKAPRNLKSKLVAVGLWDEVQGGWQIHDYLKHNKSAAVVSGIRHSKREAGAAGGKASGEARREASASTPASTSAEAPREPISSRLISTLPVSARSTPLVARRRLDAAWEGQKGLYVPQRKHEDFVQLRNHPGAERELFTWYEQVAEAWTGSPGADMFTFWTARYGEKWPSAATKPKSPWAGWTPRSGGAR